MFMETNQKQFLAHVKQEPDGGFSLHDLKEHLFEVGDMAGMFADEFGNSDWAKLAGLDHDLGKYRAHFQKRIRSETGFDPQAYIETDTNLGEKDHASVGAIHLVNKLGAWHGKIVAYLVVGHHTGLPNYDDLERRLKKKLLYEEALKQNPPMEICDVSAPTSRPPKGTDPALWIRMLFSCLVDADFLDTERFMDPDKYKTRTDYPSLESLLPHFNTYMSVKGAVNENTSKVNLLRNKILGQCKKKSKGDPGLFSLSVPTGGGKTLSSLAFALDHAIRLEKRRIIYVIPYTSIIEQTADTFRDVFKDAGATVIEHHSNLEPEKLNSNLESEKQTALQNRLACENWDGPIIVTTAVQFFESLFAARTSRCRKLHNIVNSVVVMDEAQLIPRGYRTTILDVINKLTKAYRVTCLLTTATQPAWKTWKIFGETFPGLDDIQEIIDDPIKLHDEFRGRVKVNLPEDFSKRSSWEDIANELKDRDSVLCIVNTRADCKTLHSLMPEGTIHLSRNMCGAHLSDKIKEIKTRLLDKEDIRVISTQLVEAGVDLDFPFVYRAFTGLDSIAQAAGRCNREGDLSQGQVVVFMPPSKPPHGDMAMAADSAMQILADRPDDPISPELMDSYFKQLFSKIGSEGLDKKKISKILNSDAEKLKFDFESTAKEFRMIENDWQKPVIVRYGESPELIEELKRNGLSRQLLRKLQRYIVNIPAYAHQRLLSRMEIEEVKEDIYVQVRDDLYDKDIGLSLPESESYDADKLVS